MASSYLDVILPWTGIMVAAAWLLTYYLHPYFVTYKSLRGIPAPFPAQFTNLWLLSTARRGIRSLAVDEVHKTLGTVVRVAPNHVSINDEGAFGIIYGHGHGLNKSSFYDAFVSVRTGLFSTRDRVEHTRKRKMVSHVFSPKSVHHLEPYMQRNLHLFTQKWDALADAKGARIDCVKWFNYLAFDVIGDLAFGAPFGMLAAGADVAEVRESPEAPPSYLPAVEILGRRGDVSATLGCLPELLAWAKWLPDPFFSRGVEAVHHLAGISVARVKERLERPPSVQRRDLLDLLMHGRDVDGEPLGREELTAEAQTQLIAGSDTMANTSCAILYHLVRTPAAMSKLREELDAAMPADVVVPDHDAVRDLGYLGAVINEAMRMHSTSAIGLPREMPDPGPGLMLNGHFFPPGTVLSVPTYSVHHSAEIWGADVEEFRPERWHSLTARQKMAFNPFSQGPRACVGRNVAEMELKLMTATWVRRYHVELLSEHMEIKEGFLRKPMVLDIFLRRRST